MVFSTSFLLTIHRKICISSSATKVVFFFFLCDGMKSSNSVFLLSDQKSKSVLFRLFVTTSLICGVYFVSTAWLGNDYFKLSSEVKLQGTQIFDNSKLFTKLEMGSESTGRSTMQENCKDKCMPSGSESLPKGIVAKTTSFEMQHLWGPVSENVKSKRIRSLLAIAVGINQRSLVHRIVEKFLAEDFVVMLFHYDGVVNAWNDFEWKDKVIHISAKNQTKWWFSKRFLHPDIVAEYEYIFLWDEDLGVENFHPKRYLSIVKEEGLEISQPGIDASKSEVHHHITARRSRSKVHRRYYDMRGHSKCDGNSTAPPCVGWVEMMAPVFSRAAWRCAWYMIQNDLIHAWGLDMQLGYCAQGDRTVKVGVVDEEYVVHLGLPTLGALSNNKASSVPDNRSAVRIRSYAEMKIFRSRWKNAVEEDECWRDPFPQSSEQKG